LILGQFAYRNMLFQLIQQLPASAVDNKTFKDEKKKTKKQANGIS